MKIRFSKCGHSGLGGFCHRCKEAERMLAFADGKAKRPKPSKRQLKNKTKWAFEGWTPAQFKAEAQRLQGPQKAKRRAVASVVDTAPEPA